LLVGVKLDKPTPFLGQTALRAARGQPLKKKLLSFVFDDPSHYAWGGEAIVIDGQTVGELSSAGWGFAAGACVALGYVRGPAAQRAHDGSPVTIDLWGQAVPARAFDRRPNA
jgi:4-methylaminobutanoate oxidase (formaldehyde-forming)